MTAYNLKNFETKIGKKKTTCIFPSVSFKINVLNKNEYTGAAQYIPHEVAQTACQFVGIGHRILLIQWSPYYDSFSVGVHVNMFQLHTQSPKGSKGKLLTDCEHLIESIDYHMHLTIFF